MVTIRLTRTGAKKQPSYRIIVTPKRYKRDGKYIAKLGYYNPLTQPATVVVDREQFDYWMKNGAQPTDVIKRIVLGIKGTKKRAPKVKAETTEAPKAQAAATEPAAAPQAAAPTAEPEQSAQEPTEQVATQTEPATDEAPPQQAEGPTDEEESGKEQANTENEPEGKEAKEEQSS